MNISTKWSPLHIKLILHYWTTPGLFPKPSPASDNYTNEFIELGILEKAPEEPSEFKLTRKGKAFITSLLNTEVPVEQFIDPRSNKPILFTT